MIQLNLPSGCQISLYDSARKLPEHRRVEMECYALVESGVGSSINDFDRHLDTLILMASQDRKEEWLTGLNNVRYLFYNLLHKQLSPRSLAFACLVHSVDGQVWDDTTEEGLEKLVRLLSEKGLTDELVTDNLAIARGKSMGD